MRHTQQDQNPSCCLHCPWILLLGPLEVQDLNRGDQGLGRAGSGAFVCVLGGCKWEGALGSRGLSRPLAWTRGCHIALKIRQDSELV